jgi:MoaA/NifB/PqqE/SkfB family radical SAM enzyme
MFEDLSGKEYHSSIVDVTDKCNLRCKHCFYFREERDSQEMDADEFLKGIEILQQRHKIISMGWCGGEPLYRTEVVKQGAKHFQMNQLFTNGTLPIPEIPGLIPFVSMDGTRELHDAVRGKGVYDKVIDNVKDSPASMVLFLATFHKLNQDCLEDMVAELSKIKNTAIAIMTFIPLKKYKKVKGYSHTDTQIKDLDFSWDERDRFIDRVIALKSNYPAFVMNSEINLQMMKKENAIEATSRCNMPKRTLTLDLHLNRKLPCVMGGPDIDCSKCGCPFPYEQEARRRGLKDKVGIPVDKSGVPL